MPVSDEYITYVIDQLGSLGPVTARRMFGGAGIYLDQLCFAIIVDDVLFFKVNNANRPDYEDAGMEPFVPFEDKPYAMSYYEVPADVLENKDRLRGWAQKALAAAAQTRKQKKRKRKK